MTCCNNISLCAIIIVRTDAIRDVWTLKALKWTCKLLQSSPCTMNQTLKEKIKWHQAVKKTTTILQWWWFFIFSHNVHPRKAILSFRVHKSFSIKLVPVVFKIHFTSKIHSNMDSYLSAETHPLVWSLNEICYNKEDIIPLDKNK